MKKKPNVIYILADDMGYGDVSACNENCGFETKNLDQIGRDGMIFGDAHSASAVCTPSRYSIMTGRYCFRNKLKSGVLGGYSASLLESGRATLGNLFKRNGYRTACVGKWHLGMEYPRNEEFIELDGFESSYDLCDGIDYDGEIKNSPVVKGFDYYFGMSGSLDMPPYVYIENSRFTAWPDHRSEPKVSVGNKGWYRPGVTSADFVHEEVLDRLCDKVIEKIEEYQSDDFFLYFPMTAPHGPILPSEKFQGKSGINEYCDFVLHCDDVVGRIQSKLKELNLYEDTILVFTADNGCSPVANFAEMKEKGHSSSYHFRGHKADIYEGGHRIPYLISWPNGIKSNVFCKETVCLTDFYATMAEVLGDSLSDKEAEDSFSNLSLWQNPQSGKVREFTVHQSIDGSLAIRSGRFKLEMCPGSGGWSYPSAQKDTKDLPPFQLYDLEEDIAERNNVIHKHPEVYKTLRLQLEDIVKNGRSTKGEKQRNNGQQIWKTVAWLEGEIE